MSELSIAEFADAIADIMPVMMREMSKQQTGGFYKIRITMPQFIVLGTLSRRDCTMTELAETLHVTTAAMTGVVDRLVRDGYVVRFGDPQDRRVVRIKITAKGAKTVALVHDEHKRATVKVFEVLSPEERRTYLALLTKVRDALVKG